MSRTRDLSVLRPAPSPADPEALARAVREHKAGDAFTQAVITLALVLAIGAVAFVLGVDRARASDLAAVSQVFGSGSLIALAGVALAGGTLLIAGLRRPRRAEARVRRTPRR